MAIENQVNIKKDIERKCSNAYSASWKCPACNHNATIQSHNFKISEVKLSSNGIFGQILIIEAITCPNVNCKQLDLKAVLVNNIKKKRREPRNANIYYDDFYQLQQEWQLLPSSCAKVFPDYIPKQLRQDYEEACAILTLSPKSSATLARRVLQGIIRDFWGIKDKKNLYEEINAIQDKADPDIWKVLHDVREVGNIGAHMEQDVNAIINIQPGEAKMLIGLIEMLFEQTYIAKDNKRLHLEKVKVICLEKKKHKISKHSSNQ